MKRLVAVLLTLGCSIESASTSAPSPSPPIPAVGSYELTVSAPAAVSDGLDARLDLESVNGSLGAVLTFDNQRIHVLSVTQVGSTLTLAVEGGVSVDSSPGRPIDHWSSITVTLGQDGIPRSATLAGVSDGMSADSPTRRNIQGTASITPDVLAPRLALRPTVTGAKRLPWEPVFLVASEPVRASDVGALVSVNVDGQSFPLAASPKVPSHAGESTSFLTPFGFLPAGAGTVTIGALRDRAQNEAKATALPFDVLDLGPAGSTFDLDAQSSSQLGTWGKVVHASGSECHAGGCLQIGDWASLACGGGAGPGIARLVSGAVSSITFAVRSKLDSPYAPTFPLGLPANALAVDVVTDTAVTTSYVSRTSVTEGWTTITVPAAGARAFAIRGVVDGSCGPEPQPSKWTVWIDDVTAL